jgi:hypothetical protein
MSADNVTPLRPQAGPKLPPHPPTKPRRARRALPGVRLAESGEFDGFSTLDVINALHGVCQALDVAFDNVDVSQQELATVARVVASIVQSRVD